jgi:hypothetical protein
VRSAERARRVSADSADVRGLVGEATGGVA